MPSKEKLSNSNSFQNDNDSNIDKIEAASTQKFLAAAQSAAYQK